MFSKEEKKANEVGVWRSCEEVPRKYLSKQEGDRKLDYHDRIEQAAISKLKALKKLDNQWNSYHVHKSSRAPLNRPGDIPPPCLIGPDVAFLNREEIDQIKKKK